MLSVEMIMTPNPVTARPDTSLSEALRLMKSHDCRQLPVVQDDRLVGILTDRDIRLAMNSPFVLHDRTEDEAVLRTLAAQDCMTPNPLTISTDDPAVLAADLMRTYKFGGLPVVKEGKLVGVVTTSDILRSYIDLLKSGEGSGSA